MVESFVDLVSSAMPAAARVNNGADRRVEARDLRERAEGAFAKACARELPSFSGMARDAAAASPGLAERVGARADERLAGLAATGLLDCQRVEARPTKFRPGTFDLFLHDDGAVEHLDWISLAPKWMGGKLSGPWLSAMARVKGEGALGDEVAKRAWALLAIDVARQAPRFTPGVRAAFERRALQEGSLGETGMPATPTPRL